MRRWQEHGGARGARRSEFTPKRRDALRGRTPHGEVRSGTPRAGLPGTYQGVRVGGTRSTTARRNGRTLTSRPAPDRQAGPFVGLRAIVDGRLAAGAEPSATDASPSTEAPAFADVGRGCRPGDHELDRSAEPRGGAAELQLRRVLGLRPGEVVEGRRRFGDLGPIIIPSAFAVEPRRRGRFIAGDEGGPSACAAGYGSEPEPRADLARL